MKSLYIYNNNSDIDPSGINPRGKRTIIIKREKNTEWILEMG